LRGERTASLAWFGDGATSEGDFHEAMNFASVFKTATIFFCTNNQWAISTPVSRQMATKTVAEKALAYAMPAVRVDGFDPLACWKATKDAADRGREGGGPTLIEAFCYRIGAHGTADDPRLYRDETETEKWKAWEPLSRMASFLDRLGVLDESGAEKIKAEAKQTIAEAVTEMEAIETPGLEVIFDNVYAKDQPWMFREGLEELRSVGQRELVKPLNAGAAETTEEGV
jgi:pyruvate dehydrogenase E1 component alpha subunit